MKLKQELTTLSSPTESKEKSKEQKSFKLSILELATLDVYNLPGSGYVYIGANLDPGEDRETQIYLLEGINARYHKNVIYNNLERIYRKLDYFIILNIEKPQEVPKLHRQALLIYVLRQWAEKATLNEIRGIFDKSTADIDTILDFQENIINSKLLVFATYDVSESNLIKKFFEFYKLSKDDQRKTLYFHLQPFPLSFTGMSFDAIEIALNEFWDKSLSQKQLYNGYMSFSEDSMINYLLVHPRPTLEILLEPLCKKENNESYAKTLILNIKKNKKSYAKTSIPRFNFKKPEIKNNNTVLENCLENQCFRAATEKEKEKGIIFIAESYSKLDDADLTAYGFTNWKRREEGIRHIVELYNNQTHENTFEVSSSNSTNLKL